mmetsp:Transcript_12845/g.28906  ORF Transcript_12845/g.28906 Transcript_12845/m.28906 type:complete len:822 (+) Transcript_12845:1-2466(+)
MYRTVVDLVAGLRSLVRNIYDDVENMFADADTELPFSRVTRPEFAQWTSSRLGIPAVVDESLFTSLDVFSRGYLTRAEYDVLLGDIKLRNAFLLVSSALGSTQGAFAKADLDGDGRISLEEFTSFLAPLGVPGTNAESLFADLDVKDRQHITREQFVVMAAPLTLLRVTNSNREELPWHSYEIKGFSDTSCTEEVFCPQPVASGHYVDLSEGQTIAYPPGRSYDENNNSRWISQCGPCEPQSGWIGCKYDSRPQIRCLHLVLTPASGTFRRTQSMEELFGVGISKVPSAVAVEVWDGLQFLVAGSATKPPSWEINNNAIPLPVLVEGLAVPAPPPPEGPGKTATAEQEESFASAIGLSSGVLLLFSSVATIIAVIFLLVCWPTFCLPKNLICFRYHAPEQIEKRLEDEMAKQEEMRRAVADLERELMETAVVQDEWGVMRKAESSSRSKAKRKLEKLRKKALQQKRKSERGQKNAERRKQLREAREKGRMERYEAMKDAYKSKTVVVEGIAVHAPHAVLRELGFDEDAITAFGLPGFDETVDAEETKRQMVEQEETERRAAETATETIAGADALTVPPTLAELELFRKDPRPKPRPRRGAFAEQGEDMAPEAVRAAQESSKNLQVAEGAKLDDVENLLSNTKFEDTNLGEDLDGGDPHEEDAKKGRTNAKFAWARARTKVQMVTALAAAAQDAVHRESESESSSSEQDAGSVAGKGHTKEVNAHKGPASRRARLTAHGRTAESGGADLPEFGGYVHKGMKVRRRDYRQRPGDVYEMETFLTAAYAAPRFSDDRGPYGPEERRFAPKAPPPPPAAEAPKKKG